MFGPTNSPIRRGALLGPMAAGLLLACSSTTTGPGQRDIVLTARLVAGQASVVPCATAQQFVQDIANVSARVDVLSVSEGPFFKQQDLAVRQAGAPDIVQLIGDVSFPVLSGRGPFLVSALGYQGDEVEGQFAGFLQLESGIGITIESLTIPTLIPQTDGTLMTTNAVLCVSSDAVEQGRTFCTTGLRHRQPEPDLRPRREPFHLLLPPAEHRLAGPGIPHRRLRAGRETGPGGHLPRLRTDHRRDRPARGSPDRRPTRHRRGPRGLGRGISGDVLVHFEDGRGPTEGGSFSLARTQRLACNPLEMLAARR